jgi:malate dehydrogenase (oxaloacetate-decarboxylating)(NADP+)
MKDLGLLSELKELEIITPSQHEKFREFYTLYSQERQRDGVSIYHAEDVMALENYFGSMMVKQGLADTFIAGPTLTYPECFTPVMNVIGTKNKRKAAGIFILVFKNKVLFLADCTAQVDPTEEDLSEIALSTAELYRNLMMKEPRIAFLSFSSFGSNKHPKATKVKKAVALTKEKRPELICDGEVQADVAVNKGIMKKLFNFSELDEAADVLIFPELNSANISYKLLSQMAECHAIGPLLVPTNATVNIVQRTSSITEIVNMATITALISEVHKQAKDNGENK